MKIYNYYFFVCTPQMALVTWRYTSCDVTTAWSYL